MSSSSDREAPAHLQTLTWPVGDEEPTGDEHVYVGFHGLFCFGYNERTGMCEVGTHSKTRDHEFQLLVYEFGGPGLPTPRLVYAFKPESYDTAGGTISIDIERPKTSGIRFFLPDFPHDSGWSQLIDFEKHYGQTLKKKKKVQKPKININNCSFYTVPSDHEFLLVTDEDPPEIVADLGHIAFLSLGAVTQLEDSGYVSITTDQEYLRLTRPTDTKLILFFVNVCPQDECDSSQNDFQEYYKTFEKPSGTRKFNLQRKPDSVSRTKHTAIHSKFLDSLFGVGGVLFHLLSSQDSPCGSSGFGLGGGGTEQPPA